MKLSSAVLLISMVGLSACAGGGSHWVHTSASQSEGEQALAQCKYEAEQATASGGLTGASKGIAQVDLVNSCMKAKGYTK